MADWIKRCRELFIELKLNHVYETYSLLDRVKDKLVVGDELVL
jgi:hypothetical protein